MSIRYINDIQVTLDNHKIVVLTKEVFESVKDKINYTCISEKKNNNVIVFI